MVDNAELNALHRKLAALERRIHKLENNYQELDTVVDMMHGLHLDLRSLPGNTDEPRCFGWRDRVSLNFSDIVQMNYLYD